MNKTDDIVKWIREWFDKNGKDCSAVIGISGGKDSTVAAMLLVKALGKDRVFGVLMPDGDQADLEDAKLVVEKLGINNEIINIKSITKEVQNALDRAGIIYPTMALINIPPRIRMTVLYAVAQSLPNGGRVANTCNYSEDYIGFSTKYGDHAGDFSILGSLFVSEVVEIGKKICGEFDIPESLITKTPSDGLTGKTDEDFLGFTYDDIENYLKGKLKDEKIIDKIEKRHEQNLHKTNLVLDTFDEEL